ncbi:MAG: RICIN domain-containing protein [Atopobiaceae bacterium]|nr:RICIN domain-containing protein [Atopobiaceae bacterium]
MKNASGITKEYATLHEAVAAASDGDTITLLADATETDIVMISKSVTIDGAGHALNSTASRGIRVNTDGVSVVLKNLTVNMNKVYDNYRGVQVDTYRKADLTLDGCTVNNVDGGGNYGVHVGEGSSGTLVVSNTKITAYQCINIYGNQTVTIDGCTLNSVNNIDSMYSGNAINVLSHKDSPNDTSKTTIRNTTTSVTGKYQNVCSVSDWSATSTVVIESGSFDKLIGNNGADEGMAATKNITITGGKYAKDPSVYAVVPADYVVAKTSDKTYPYQVIPAATVVDTAPTVAEAAVDPTISEKSKEVQEAANTAAEQLASSSAEGLEAVASSAADAVTTEDVQAQATKLSDSGVTVNEDDRVTVFVQPSIEVTVKDVTVDATTNKTTALTLDVTAYVQQIATTATDPAAIKTEGDGQNAIVVEGSKKVVEPTGNVTLTLPLARDFAASKDPTTGTIDNVAVKHVKGSGDTYYYKANVTGDNVNGYVATVEDTHGFSTMTIFAVDKTQATITYKDGDATVGSRSYAIQDVFNGTALPTVTDLNIAKDGYTFKGWKIDSSKALYTTMTGNLWSAIETNGTQGDDGNYTATMTAAWEADAHTVTFDKNADDATGATASEKVTYGDVAKALTANGFTRDGYRFSGWNTKADGTGTAYAADASVSNLTADLTLYAQWTKQCTVTFDTDGGSAAPDAQTVPAGWTAKDPGDPTKTGYTFQGWQLDGKAFAFGTPLTDSITLKAAWKANPYTINIKTSAADPTSLVTVDATYGTPAKLPDASDARLVPPTGKKLAGFTADGKTYNPGQTVSDLVSTDGGSIDLVCVWVDNTALVITFEPAIASDPSVTGSMSNQVVTGATTLSPCAFAKPGWHFVDWTATISLNNISGGAAVSQSSIDGQDISVTSLTLQANWAINAGIISFSANEGSGSAPDSINTNTQVGSAANLPDGTGLSKAGYDFAGWNTAADGSGTTYAAGSKASGVLIPTTGDEVTLYAKWTAHAYAVTFSKNADDATGTMKDMTVTFGEPAQTLAANGFERPGYRFSGWNTEAAPTAEKSGTAYAADASVSNLTADLALYAQWTKSYTVSFDTSGYDSQTVDAGNAVTPVADPTKTGYTFAGWYYDDGAGNSVMFDFKNALTNDTVTGSSSLDLTAAWNANAYTVTFVDDYSKTTATQDFTYDVAQDLNCTATFSRVGYHQVGWTTAHYGKGTKYDTQQAGVKNLKSSGDFKLYVLWEANSDYKVSYDLDDGTPSTDVANPKEGVSWTSANLLPAVGLTKSGYVFAGWVDSKGNGVTKDTVLSTLPECNDSKTGAAQEPAENTVTLTATWIPYTEAPVITTGADLGTATKDVAYSKQLAFAGVPDTGTWSVASGSTLPAGLKLSKEGLLSGTPTTAKDYAFELKVDNGSGSVTKKFTLKVAAKTTITTEFIADGLVSAGYSQQLDATGENVTWSVADGDLPDGITLAAGGLLSGTPTETGTYTFAVTATSATTGYATKIYQLDVYEAPTITTPSVPDMVVGTAVSQQLDATGEPADFMWSVKGGSLPTGLKLSKDGLLSGTPTTAGTYTFTVAADNDMGTPGTKSYTVVVRTPADALYQVDVLGVGTTGKVYTVKSGVNASNAVDIAGASTKSGANAQVWSDNETPAQRFLVQYHAVQGGKGYYTFKNVLSGKVLDVAGGSKASGANVQQYESNGSKAQQWVLVDAGNGLYAITNVGSGMPLDVAGASSASGANLQQYKANGTSAQKFRLDSCQTASDEGVSIASSVKGSPVLDVAGASKSAGANVQIWTSNGTKAQDFVLAYDAATGYYSITNAGSGLVLDVAGAGSAPGTNVWQYTANGSLAQRWSLVKVAGGYEIYSACNGLVLDVAGASSKAGTNVQVYEPNHTAAQVWTLESID